MLFLIPSPAPNRYNYHLHVGSFVAGLTALGHTVATYGSSGKLTYHREKHRDVLQLIDKIRPDVYISLAPDVEWHQVKEAGRRFPHMITVGSVADFHYKPNMRTFECCDLILLRGQNHIASVRADSRIRWYPFSVDETQMPAFVSWADRGRRVFFAGAAQADVYPVREAATRVLQTAKLLDTTGSYLGYKHYLERAAKCRFSLSCQSKYKIQPAKLVEYAAAGTIPLFDDQAYGEAVVPHVLPYRPETLVAQIRREVLVDDWATKAQANRAHVLAHHTHKIRAQQLLDWIIR